jgi:hypothetical protein
MLWPDGYCKWEVKEGRVEASRRYLGKNLMNKEIKIYY